MSLSQFNHGEPRVQAYPEIVQGATAFHHPSTPPLLPQPEAGSYEAPPLDTASDVRAPPPPLVERLVRPLVLPRQLLAAGCLGRPEAHHLRARARQEAQSLEEPAPRWQRRR